MAEIGHNSGDTLDKTAQGRIKSFVERIEDLEIEKSAIAEAIKEVKSEAKGEGFDIKVLNLAIKKRKIDKAKGQETYSVLQLYCHALGDVELADLA